MKSFHVPKDLVCNRERERERENARRKSSKVISRKRKGSGNEVMSAQQAEDLKMKEKRKREGRGKNKKENTGLSLVNLVYQQAKAAKAVKKAMDAGKIVQEKASKKSKPPPQRTQSRTEEMWELFQSEMSERAEEK